MRRSPPVHRNNTAKACLLLPSHLSRALKVFESLRPQQSAFISSQRHVRQPKYVIDKWHLCHQEYV